MTVLNNDTCQQVDTDLHHLVDEFKQREHEELVDSMLPCPQCGGLAWVACNLFNIYRAVCVECEHEGEVYDTVREVVKEWNKR